MSLLCVGQVAASLGCSPRHFRRLVERGEAPSGVKLGALRRWSVDEIRRWVEGGCRPVAGEKKVAR